MNSRFLLAMVLAAALAGLSFTFSQEEKVMDEIMKTLRDISRDIRKAGPDKLVKFRYSTRTVQASGEQAVETSTLYKRGDRVCLRSGRATCFMDPANVFLILPGEKTIIHHQRSLTDSDREALKESGLARYEAMLEFQRVLLTGATVVSLTEVEEAGRRLTLVEFTPDHEVEELRRIARVRIWYDRRDKSLRRIWTRYAPGFRLQEILTTYEELSYDSADKELKREVASYVVNHKKQPIGPYAGYRLLEE